MSFVKVLSIIEDEMTKHGCGSYADLVDAPMGLALLSMTIDEIQGMIPDDEFDQIMDDLDHDPRLHQQLKLLPSSDISQSPYHFEQGYTEVPSWFWKLN